MTGRPSSDTQAAASACPICGKPTQVKTRPFCSRRCADLDLHRWLSGVYVARGAEEEGNEDDSRASAPKSGDEFP
jgi:endogenous inhibitor of DNA gyrase (YacG/DUF329 family)